MVQVTDVQIAAAGDRRILSGRIDGWEARFDFHDAAHLTSRGEPFLALALFKAMAAGEPLEICAEAPLDPKLATNLPLVQALHHQWNPELRPVEVRARVATASRSVSGVLSSFSGGVDSTATLIDHFEAITHLLTLNAFDGATQGSAFAPLVAKVQAFGRRQGKQVIDVQTNAAELCTALRMNWAVVHGPLLCLIAGALGFERFYIPSSGTYENLKPWGSHPVLDPLWSTSRTEVVHDGAHRRRSEKVALIAKRPDMLSQLQVCWTHQTTNCGRCSKCLKTLLVLNTIGAAKRARFPERRSADLVREIVIDSDLHAVFTGRDLVALLRRHGELRLARQLETKVRRFRDQRNAKRLLRSLVGRSLLERGRSALGRAGKAKPVRIVDPDDLWV